MPRPRRKRTAHTNASATDQSAVAEPSIEVLDVDDQAIRTRNTTLKPATSPNPFDGVAIPAAIRPHLDFSKPVAAMQDADVIDRIQQIGAHLDGTETYQTPLYWMLGEGLDHLKTLKANGKRKYGQHGEWEQRLEKWGIGRRRATDAMSIYRQLTKAECETLPVTKAAELARERKREKEGKGEPAGREQQEPGDPLTRWEYQAAERLIKVIGSVERSIDVLTALQDGAEIPAEKPEYKLLAGVRSYITPKCRAEFRSDPIAYLAARAAEAQAEEDRHNRAVAKAISAADTDSKRAELHHSLRAIDDVSSDHRSTAARAWLCQKRVDSYRCDPVSFTAKLLHEARQVLNLPADDEGFDDGQK